MLRKTGHWLSTRNLCYTKALKHEKKLLLSGRYSTLRVMGKLAFLNKKITEAFSKNYKILLHIHSLLKFDFFLKD